MKYLAIMREIAVPNTVKLAGESRPAGGLYLNPWAIGTLNQELDHTKKFATWAWYEYKKPYELMYSPLGESLPYLRAYYPFLFTVDYKEYLQDLVAYRYSDSKHTYGVIELELDEAMVNFIINQQVLRELNA